MLTRFRCPDDVTSEAINHCQVWLISRRFLGAPGEPFSLIPSFVVFRPTLSRFSRFHFRFCGYFTALAAFAGSVSGRDWVFHPSSPVLVIAIFSRLLSTFRLSICDLLRCPVPELCRRQRTTGRFPPEETEEVMGAKQETATKMHASVEGIGRYNLDNVMFRRLSVRKQNDERRSLPIRRTLIILRRN